MDFRNVCETPKSKSVTNFLPTVINQIAETAVNVDFFRVLPRRVHAQFIAVREFCRFAGICLILRDCAVHLEKYVGFRALSRFVSSEKIDFRGFLSLSLWPSTLSIFSFVTICGRGAPKYVRIVCLDYPQQLLATLSASMASRDYSKYFRAGKPGMQLRDKRSECQK